MEALAEQPDAQWLRDLGIQFRLDYGSRPLHTSGLDSSRAYVGLRNLGNSCCVVRPRTKNLVWLCPSCESVNPEP